MKTMNVDRDLLGKLIEKNEVATNKLVSLAALQFVLMPVLVQILLFVNYNRILQDVNYHVFFPMAVLLLIFIAIARKKQFSAPWLKYMLLGGIILAVNLAFFVYTMQVCYLLFLPTIIAVRYFDKKLLQQVSVVSITCFLLVSALSIVLETASPYVQKLHDLSLTNNWGSLLSTAHFTVLPMLIVMMFLTDYSKSITRSGHRLMETQFENATRIAVQDTQLSLSVEIQRGCLPPGEFTTPDQNFCLSAVEITAQDVGGDFYDYYMIDEHRMAVLIADVSDIGVSAALFMMSAKKAIQCAVACTNTLRKAITMANKLICQDNKAGMFLTLWLGILDTRSGVGTYINAGHLPPLLRHADGTTERLTNVPDLFIGNFPDMTPDVHTFRIEKGDILLLYTDGITDSVSVGGVPFGTERLIKSVSSAPGNASGVKNAAIEAVLRHSRGADQFDDMTLLAMECRVADDPHNMILTADTLEMDTEEWTTRVNTFVRGLNCPENTRRSIDVIMDEVCSNIRGYAYGEGHGEIRLSVTGGVNYIKLHFADSGTPFNPLERQSPVLNGEPQIGGLGIHLIRNLADSVSYAYTEGKNVLHICVLWRN